MAIIGNCMIFIMVMMTCPFSKCDPCKDYKRLGDMDRRYTSYITGSDENDICDMYLHNDGGEWFLAEVDMPTSPPSLYDCGTTFPIWFNGTLPKKTNEETSGRGCVVDSKTKKCIESYPVRVHKCDKFSVYFLKPTTKCAQAYCFGTGIADTPPTETLQNVVIQTELIPDEDDAPSKQIIGFVCYFGDSSILKSPFYQVTWVVNGESILTLTKSKTHLSNLILTEKDMKKLDVTINCVVRAKNNIKGRPGPSAKSSDFFAGISITSTVLTIAKNQEENINFRFTVPFGCLTRPGRAHKCVLRVEMYAPDNTDKSCRGKLSVNSRFCRHEIHNDNWNETQSIKIRYRGVGKYTSKYNNYILNLRVRADESDIWNNHALPSIKVNVNEAPDDWIGKVCESHNDPHMKTFDGRKYEHQEKGVYMLYEHKDQNRQMQVQIKLKSCHPPYQVNFCNCGVAVRAGGDVFIADKCDDDVDKHLFEYRTCHDKILDVRRQKKNDRQYSIFFPTGTRVDITASIRYFNVDIKASLHDTRNTRGLCGFLSDTCKDDFKLRNNALSSTSGTDDECNDQHYTVLHPKDFTKSWRIDDKSGTHNENLFSLSADNQTIKLWNNDDNYCTCPPDTKEADEFDCSPSYSVPCERNKHYDSIGSKTCHEKPLRKKRSIEYPWKSFRRYRRERSVVSNEQHDNVTMTANEAKQYCQHTLGASSVFKACSQVPNVQSESSLEACALDIQLSGSLSWTKATMESFKSNCFGELIDNSTLSEEPEDGGMTIAEAVREVLCPGLPECSGNGVCVNGTCDCANGYIASDCSVDKTTPPVMFGVRGDGLCDLTEIECDTAFVLGEDVGSSPNLSCSIQNYHVSNNGKRVLASSWIAMASLETIMEVHCPLTVGNNTRHKRDTVVEPEKFVESYSIGISYDMVHFGDELELFIFNSKCQVSDTHSNLPQFVVKNGTCFIDGRCYIEGEQKVGDICSVCTPQYPYVWSIPSSVTGCIKVDNTENMIWVAGPVIGTLLAVALVSAAILIYQKRARAKVKMMKTVN